MRDDDEYKPHPDRPAPLLRQPKPGEEVWRLRDNETGRVQVCELRDDTRAGAGWDVSLFQGNELLISRRCGTEEHARYCAEVMKQDTLHHGWVEEDRKALERGC
jgi:hypothetical protein